MSFPMQVSRKKLRKLSPLAAKSLLCLAGGYVTYKAVTRAYTKYYPNSKNKNAKLPFLNEPNLTLNPSQKGEKEIENMTKLLKIMKIIFPDIWNKQFAYIVAHTCVLITRACLSVYVAGLDGRLTKSIVERRVKRFIYYIFLWIGIAVPATFVNSLLKYLEGKISLSFRTVLVKHAYDLYFDKQAYYKVGNLDSRLTAVDESLTEDLNLWSTAISHLYSHLTKPVLDIVLVTVILVNIAWKRGQSGLLPSILAAVVTIGTGKILKMCSPKFGKLVAQESACRGNLRTVHSRIINNAEEIAFYGGHQMEKGVVMKCYELLAEQINKTLNKKLWYITLEQFLMKYVWSASGLTMIAIPVMLGKADAVRDDDADGDLPPSEEESQGMRTQHYMTARNLLASGADAIERLISSLKEVTELCGYTDRVYNMITVFEDVHNNKFLRASSEGQMMEEITDPSDFQHGSIVPVGRLPRVTPTYNSGYVDLKDVPVIAPSGDIVCPKLSIKITPGTHFLITGPNGCGKSSLFRILSGIWPVYGGQLSIPFPTDMFYIPQRPYMSLGSFRDQIIYPDEFTDMKTKGWQDEQLEKILDIVHLTHVLRRERGWDSVNDWMDLLSGGEKQRMAMARMFYHKPKFALLDECTSAVSIDVEGKIYQAAKDVGITLLTITHRPSLWKYHDRLLKFDGQGDWCIEEMNSSSRLTLKEEKEQLESRLAGLPKLQKRLDELCIILGESQN